MRGGLLRIRKKKNKNNEKDFDLDTMFEEIEIDLPNC